VIPNLIKINYLSLRLMVDDDRVVPMHSFKLAATLQYVAAGNPHPLLLRLEMKAGHGAGKSTELK
jgi:prolyl oligopeptidase